LGLLSSDYYPRLCDRLKYYIENVKTTAYDERTIELDAEEFIDWAYHIADRPVITTDSSSFSNRLLYAGAIGEAWYFVWDIVRHFSVAHNPHSNNYQRIIESFPDNPFTVITTNYDTLFESIAVQKGFTYDYLLSEKASFEKNEIPIAKIHGSINWLNKFDSLASFGGVSGVKKLLEKVAPVIHSNKTWSQLRIPSALEICNYSLSSLLRSGMDYDEPVIIPPLGNNKDFEKNAEYKRVWNMAEGYLKRCSDLVIIGSSLRPEDKRFCEAIASNVKTNTKLTGVNRNRAPVTRLAQMLRVEEDKIDFCPSFEEYTETL
jgi:hypothetical protein